MIPVFAMEHQRAASRLHIWIVCIFGILAFTCIVGGIVAVCQNAKSETEFNIFGAHLTTGHVGVAFVALGLIIAYFTVRSVLNNQRDIAALPTEQQAKLAADDYATIKHLPGREQGGAVSSPVTPPFDQSVFKTRPFPTELRDSIDAAPVLHRAARAREFSGLKIQWKTALETAHEAKGGLISLMLLDRGNYPWVNCDVPKDKYPELLLARKGIVIWVAGQIANFSDNIFVVEKPELQIILP